MKEYGLRLLEVYLDKPITYVIQTEFLTSYLCLCTNNQWVHIDYLREDDVRLEFMFNLDAQGDSPISPAEKMIHLLRGNVDD